MSIKGEPYLRTKSKYGLKGMRKCDKVEIELPPEKPRNSIEQVQKMANESGMSYGKFLAMNLANGKVI